MPCNFLNSYLNLFLFFQAHKRGLFIIHDIESFERTLFHLRLVSHYLAFLFGQCKLIQLRADEKKSYFNGSNYNHK